MNQKIIFVLIFLTGTANAGALEDALGDFKFLLYSIAAGVAIVLLTIHGIKLKLANSPEERKEAKRGIVFVILGLALIILAAAVVELIYRIPEIESSTITSAESWKNSGATASGNSMGFRFEIKNEENKTFTNVLVTVNAMDYVSCNNAIAKFDFPPIGEFPYGMAKAFSYDNFCSGSKKFSIQVKSDQTLWYYCATCPENGGSCSLLKESC